MVERLPYVQQNRTVAAGAGHNAQEWRYLNAGLSKSGIAAPTDCKVAAAGSGMNVTVAAGGAFIPDAAAPAGLYHAYNDASVTVPVPAAHLTLPRIDRVVYQVLDTAFGDGQDQAKIAVVPGTAAASPVAPALPRASIPLATVSVTANLQPPIPAGNVTDGRILAGSAAAARGMVWSFDVGSLPGTSRQVTDATPTVDCFTGQVIPLEIGRLYAWSYTGPTVFANSGAGGDIRVRHASVDFETVWLWLAHTANLTTLAGYHGKAWKATATSVSAGLRLAKTVGTGAITINAGSWLQLFDMGAQPA